MEGVDDRGAAFCLGSQKARQAVDEPQLLGLNKALPDATDDVAVADGHHHEIGDCEAERLDDFERDGLLALARVGIEAGVAVIPTPAARRLQAEVEGLIVGAVDSENFGAKGDELGDLGARRGLGNEDARLHAD